METEWLKMAIISKCAIHLIYFLLEMSIIDLDACEIQRWTTLTSMSVVIRTPSGCCCYFPFTTPPRSQVTSSSLILRGKVFPSFI